MLTTNHALIRARERTKTTLDEVSLLIKQHATILLGGWENYKYHLFYSNADQNTRIAVVSRENIVSIWYTHFRLPSRVTKVTPLLATRAKAKFLHYQKLNPGNFIEEDTHTLTPHNYAARVVVYDNRSVVYTDTPIPLHEPNAEHEQIARELLASRLHVICTLIHENMQSAVGTVVICIEVLDSKGQRVRNEQIGQHLFKFFLQSPA